MISKRWVLRPTVAFFWKEREKLIPVPLLLPIPPNNMIVSEDMFAFQFLPHTQWKNCKTGAWNQKVMQGFVCALKGKGKRWTERKQKPIVLLWAAANPPYFLLFLVPQGVCFVFFFFSKLLWQKKNVFGNRGNLFCKMILFSPILAIGDSAKMKAWNWLLENVCERRSCVFVRSTKDQITVIYAKNELLIFLNN